jgi:hypothetical protein
MSFCQKRPDTILQDLQENRLERISYSKRRYELDTNQSLVLLFGQYCRSWVKA